MSEAGFDSERAGNAVGEHVQPTGVTASRLMMGREAIAWTLPEQIAVALGDRILGEQLAPGSRIGEEALAQEFQVSRGPIRDALKILEHAGLVEISSRRGAVATALTRQEFREILEVRETLFVFAVRAFRRERNDETLAQMRRHLAALEAAAASAQTLPVFTDALDRIMLFVAHHCGNRRIGRILTMLSLQSYRYLRRGHTRGPYAAAGRANSLRFYRELMQAFEEGRDVDPLVLALRDIYEARMQHIGDFLP
jgi:DNA-binding GntR family transcriptional regulator